MSVTVFRDSFRDRFRDRIRDGFRDRFFSSLGNPFSQLEAPNRSVPLDDAW